MSIKPGLSNILVEQSLSSQETWPDANENVKVFEPPAHLETHCTDGDVKVSFLDLDFTVLLFRKCMVLLHHFMITTKT